MNVKRVLQKVVEMKASDLHVKVGTKPIARVKGELVMLDEPAPTQADMEAVVDQILTPKQKRVFEETKEVDFAFGVTGLAFDLMRVGGEWRIMTHTETVILCVNYPALFGCRCRSTTPWE